MACDAFDAALSRMIPRMRNRMIAILTPAAPRRFPALPRRPFDRVAEPSASAVNQLLTRAGIVLNKHLIKPAIFVTLLGVPAAWADPPHSRARAPEAFGDWQLDCRAGSCAIVTRVAGTDGSEVLRLALAAGVPRGLAVTTPLPLHLPDGLTLAFGARPERAVAWRTCGAAGCEATLAADAELLDGLRRERGGTAAFTLVTGEQVRLPFSLMGFSAALRALDAGGAG